MEEILTQTCKNTYKLNMDSDDFSICVCSEQQKRSMFNWNQQWGNKQLRCLVHHQRQLSYIQAIQPTAKVAQPKQPETLCLLPQSKGYARRLKVLASTTGSVKAPKFDALPIGSMGLVYLPTCIIIYNHLYTITSKKNKTQVNHEPPNQSLNCGTLGKQRRLWVNVPYIDPMG